MLHNLHFAMQLFEGEGRRSLVARLNRGLFIPSLRDYRIPWTNIALHLPAFPTVMKCLLLKTTNSRVMFNTGQS